MAIKVKHEGNATSKIVAAKAGGRGKRAAEDARWMAELAAREQMNADQLAQQRQLQAMQMATGMARPGSTHAQLTHAPTSSAPLGGHGGTARTTTGTGGTTRGSAVSPSGGGASGAASPGGILRNARGEVFRVAPGQKLSDVVKGMKMTGGSGATGSYVLPMTVKTVPGDIPGEWKQVVVPDESRVGGDSAAYFNNKGWQGVTDRKGNSRSDTTSVDGFEFIPDTPGLQKIAGPEFNNAIGGGGRGGGGGRQQAQTSPEDLYDYKLSSQQRSEIAKISSALDDARRSGRFTDDELAELERQATAKRLGIQPLPTPKGETPEPVVKMIEGQPFVLNGNKWDPVRQPRPEKSLTLNDVLRNVPTKKSNPNDPNGLDMDIPIDERLDMAQRILDRINGASSPAPEAQPDPLAQMFQNYMFGPQYPGAPLRTDQPVQPVQPAAPAPQEPSEVEKKWSAFKGR